MEALLTPIAEYLEVMEPLQTLLIPGKHAMKCESRKITRAL